MLVFVIALVKRAGVVVVVVAVRTGSNDSASSLSLSASQWFRSTSIELVTLNARQSSSQFTRNVPRFGVPSSNCCAKKIAAVLRVAERIESKKRADGVLYQHFARLKYFKRHIESMVAMPGFDGLHNGFPLRGDVRASFVSRATRGRERITKQAGARATVNGNRGAVFGSCTETSGAKTTSCSSSAIVRLDNGSLALIHGFLIASSNDAVLMSGRRFVGNAGRR